MTPVPKMGARHRFDGQVTLGNPTVWPKYRIKHIAGLGSLGEREDQRDPAYGRTGEISRRSERRGKTVTYEGTILARSLLELRQAESDLLAAFAPTDPRRMDLLTPLDDQQPEMFYMAESMACDVDDVHVLPDPSTGGGIEWQRPFVIAVRMADPRVLETTVQAASSAAVPVGLTLPQTLPVTFQAGAVAGGVASAGTAPTDPVIDVQGPFGALTVMNQTLGRRLVVPGFAVPAGSFARVDFAARTVTIEGVTDVTGLVDFARSNWWDIDQWGLAPLPGARAPWTNVLRAYDSTTGAPLTFTVTFNNANWG